MGSLLTAPRTLHCVLYTSVRMLGVRLSTYVVWACSVSGVIGAMVEDVVFSDDFPKPTDRETSGGASAAPPR